jgi:hypothetical protein
LDLTLLIVTAVILLGAAASFQLWGAPLLPRLGAGPDVTRGLGRFVQLSLWLAALATIVLLVSSLALDAMSIRFGWFSDGGPRESVSDRHPLLETFPFNEGASWTYAYTEETDAGVDTGVITETVITDSSAISDDLYLAEVTVTGRTFLSHCPENGVHGGESAYWIVSDASHVYVACSRAGADALVAELARGRGAGSDEVPGKVPEFVYPLQEGAVWQAFPGRPVDEDDPAYQWFVDSQVDVDVPAGTFRDCYRVRLSTLPDTLIRWLCPGVGIAATEYTHHGALLNYRAELISYEIPPQGQTR